MPLKYGGLVTTKSKVRVVCHVVMSVFISSISVSFNFAFCAQADNISGLVSRPVICAYGLWVCMHNATPPVPMPASNTVFDVFGAKAANHTASDVGLYMPR